VTDSVPLSDQGPSGLLNAGHENPAPLEGDLSVGIAEGVEVVSDVRQHTAGLGVRVETLVLGRLRHRAACVGRRGFSYVVLLHILGINAGQAAI